MKKETQNAISQLVISIVGALSFLSMTIFVIESDEKWFNRMTLGFICWGIILICNKIEEVKK